MPAKRTSRTVAKKKVAQKATRKKTSSKANAIEVRGARQHNLKGFDVDITLGEMTVVTGPSGSGKSSLAFHTLYAEGQRRYVETFSPYVRQFFDRMDKPAVDRIDHIPPAIAIEQKNQIRTTRSTVGTLTEINDYLKLLYPRLAKGYHPKTGEEIAPDSPTSACIWSLENLLDEKILITFPISIPAETKSAELFPFLQGQGYLRILLPDGTIQRTDEENESFVPEAKVQIIQDRLKVSKRNKLRLFEAFEAAFRLGKGEASIRSLEVENGKKERAFSTSWAPLQKPTSALFTFNNPLGACPDCRGFGRVIGIDLKKAVPNPSLSIAEGCVKPFQGERGEECQRDLENYAPEVGIDLDEPFRDLTPDQQDWLLYGEGNGHTSADQLWKEGKWYGVKGFFDWMESKAYKMHVRIFLARYRSYTECGSCRGRRLRPEALAFQIEGKTLPQLWQLPVEELAQFLSDLEKKIKADKSLREDKTLALILFEITSRLQYLLQVGLSYLTLDRPARTLSGGEIARVNLTTCLGTSLSQTLFVLDEPTVGLHPRDITALIGVMKELCEKGNTLLVVEHDEAVMRAAETLLDIGPRSGQHGGELIYQGKPEGPKTKSKKSQSSITLPYLSGEKLIPYPKERRKVKELLTLSGINKNNLRDVELKLPLNLFTCLTGVSGSGKSTLANDALHLNLALRLGQDCEGEPAPIASLNFPKNSLSAVQLVDQTPLARTPKSTPGVYLGAFEAIRQLFTLTPEAKSEALKPGYFSFNSGAGRCERCLGNGFEKVEMQFLSDLYLTCPECEGRRYHQSALAFKYQGYSIADVLELTIEEYMAAAQSIQENNPLPKKEESLLRKSGLLLQPLVDVGLGYLRLGQPLNTLSGGESQRLKLCQLLGGDKARTKTGDPSSLLILDEPTTGLHFSDIERLLIIFQRLVDNGHTLLVIEHNLDVIKCADHIIRLGTGSRSQRGPNCCRRNARKSGEN